MRKVVVVAFLLFGCGSLAATSLVSVFANTSISNISKMVGDTDPESATDPVFAMVRSESFLPGASPGVTAVASGIIFRTQVDFPGCGDPGSCLFNNLLPSLSAFTMTQFGGIGGGPVVSVAFANSHITDTESLLATGGLGSGVLRLNLILGGGSFATSAGSYSLDGSSFVCPNNPDGAYTCNSNQLFTIDVPITFGTYFSITESLTQSSADSGQGSFVSVLHDYSLIQDGSVIQGAQLVPSPEPGSALLLIFGITVAATASRFRVIGTCR